MGIGEIGELLRKSTVHVRSGRGAGSAIIWDSAGVILSNAHVIAGRDVQIDPSGMAAVFRQKSTHAMLRAILCA